VSHKPDGINGYTLKAYKSTPIFWAFLMGQQVQPPLLIPMGCVPPAHTPQPEL